MEKSITVRCSWRRGEEMTVSKSPGFMITHISDEGIKVEQNGMGLTAFYII